VHLSVGRRAYSKKQDDFSVPRPSQYSLNGLGGHADSARSAEALGSNNIFRNSLEQEANQLFYSHAVDLGLVRLVEKSADFD
jgi:hypothetical protein